MLSAVYREERGRVSFGRECREKEFLLDPAHHFINHGSTGSIPKDVFNKRVQLLQDQESNPFYWNSRYARPLWEENIEAAAKFIGADPDNLTLIPNVTTGVNSIVNSIPLTADDAILVNSWTFWGTRNACHAAITKAGGELLHVDWKLPILSHEDVMDRYSKMLCNNPNIKLVVLDAISCPTATVWPVLELVTLCKQHNALVLVDAAHAPGQMALHVEEMASAGMDFFLGSFHKWAFTPRGCAVLWRHPRHSALVYSVITSYNDLSPFTYKSESFHDNFFQQGTSDRTNLLVLKHAVEFYKRMGGLEAIRSYNVSLAERVVTMLLEKWGTSKFPIPESMEAPFMRLVRVPDLTSYPIPELSYKVPCMHTSLMRELAERYGVTCRINLLDGVGWVRLSLQIYNVMEDYEALADAILDIKRRDHETNGEISE